MGESAGGELLPGGGGSVCPRGGGGGRVWGGSTVGGSVCLGLGGSGGQGSAGGGSICLWGPPSASPSQPSLAPPTVLALMLGVGPLSGQQRSSKATGWDPSRMAFLMTVHSRLGQARGPQDLQSVHLPSSALVSRVRSHPMHCSSTSHAGPGLTPGASACPHSTSSSCYSHRVSSGLSCLAPSPSGTCRKISPCDQSLPLLASPSCPQKHFLMH